MATIKRALKYPFVKFARLWNFWWFLVPVWGWFVGMGYFVRLVNEIKKGKGDELPAIRPFLGLFSTGFFLVVGLIPQIILVLLAKKNILFPWSLILAVYFILILPIQVLQFAEKRRIRDGLDVTQATKTALTHLGPFLITWLKMLVVTIIWILASLPVITLLITLPALSFGQYRLFTDFYIEASEKQKKKEKVERRKAIERDVSVSISFRKGKK